MYRHLLAAFALLAPAVAAALEDPMRPPMAVVSIAKKAPAEAEYVLSAVTIARERRTAVINGKGVEVGGVVGGAKVTEILPTQVRLQQGGRELVVRLVPVSVKTPVQTEKREQQ